MLHRIMLMTALGLLVAAAAAVTNRPSAVISMIL